MERLRIVEEGQERYCDLANRVVTVGRSSKNDISLKDRNTSRRHCNVLQVGDSWFAVDCDSHNGTFVNGVRISKKELVNGDRISIGEVNIYFLTGKDVAQPGDKKDAAEPPSVPNAAALDKKGQGNDKAEEILVQEKRIGQEKMEELSSLSPMKDITPNKEDVPLPAPVLSKVDEIDKELMEASQKMAAVSPEPLGFQARPASPAKQADMDMDMENPMAAPVVAEKEIAHEKEREKMSKSGLHLTKELNQLRDLYHRFQSQMAFHLIGQEKIGKLLITALLAGGHCLIQGDNLAVKAIIANRAAKGLNLAFRHIYWNASYAQETLRKANIILLQNAPVELAASVMCESRLKLVSSGDRSYRLPEPYLLVLNEDSTDGTTLSKSLENFFVFSVPLASLALQEEISLLEMSAQEGENERTLLSPQEFQNFQRLVDSIKISRACLEYIGRIIRLTRPAEEDALPLVKEKINKGCHPIVGIWIIKGAQATAALHGREAVSAKDIQAIARYLIPSRLLLSMQALQSGDTGETIYHAILSKLKEPVE
jgi:MoxR-like ATPase